MSSVNEVYNMMSNTKDLCIPILTFLDLDSLEAVAASCKFFNSIVDELWEDIYNSCQCFSTESLESKDDFRKAVEYNQRLTRYSSTFTGPWIDNDRYFTNKEYMRGKKKAHNLLLKNVWWLEISSDTELEKGKYMGTWNLKAGKQFNLIGFLIVVRCGDNVIYKHATGSDYEIPNEITFGPFTIDEPSMRITTKIMNTETTRKHDIEFKDLVYKKT
ncbi:hypothetical protein AKO1_001757 [Acrasis kona]|uniref:F-box domain-containing protein n=1 Tax=Acrasis kona TaxID=1008807 RepID=A0AAW2ZA35_9EUKA